MPTSRALRLGSGVVLGVYVASHLFNHALGLVSLDAAEQGVRVALVVWHSALGILLLYSAFAVHLVLAMLGLYQRPTLRLPAVELLRIGAGLAISMPLAPLPKPGVDAADSAQSESLQNLRVQILSVYGVLLAAVASARGVRAAREHRD
ncbi:MAG: hypothetical protein ABIP34_02870 [Rhodoferax sp.]